MPVKRYFIYLGYNGKSFCGWQIQPNGMTVQQCIEEALTHNGVLGPLSTEVYPKVALRNNTNPINIERNIRNSITLAQKHCQDGVLNTIFAGSTVSNRAFLAYLLDQVIISYSQLDKSIKF